MKKIIFILILFLCFNTQGQHVNAAKIKFGNFKRNANYKALKKKGGIYADLVRDAVYYKKTGTSRDSRFEYSLPSGTGSEHVDFVTVAPARGVNLSIDMEGHKGIFLNHNKLDHTIVEILSTGEKFVLKCLNAIIYMRTYSYAYINPKSSGTKKSGNYKPGTPTTGVLGGSTHGGSGATTYSGGIPLQPLNKVNGKNICSTHNAQGLANNRLSTIMVDDCSNLSSDELMEKFPLAFERYARDPYNFLGWRKLSHFNSISNAKCRARVKKVISGRSGFVRFLGRSGVIVGSAAVVGFGASLIKGVLNNGGESSSGSGPRTPGFPEFEPGDTK